MRGGMAVRWPGRAGCGLAGAGVRAALGRWGGAGVAERPGADGALAGRGRGVRPHAAARRGEAEAPRAGCRRYGGPGRRRWPGGGRECRAFSLGVRLPQAIELRSGRGSREAEAWQGGNGHS